MTPMFVVPPACSGRFGDLPQNHLSNALELAAFCDEPPDRYFAYIDEADARLTTWMGSTLGRVTFGRRWRGNMGDERQHIRVDAISGLTYSGTYYRSAGNYARIKRVRVFGEAGAP